MNLGLQQEPLHVLPEFTEGQSGVAGWTHMSVADTTRLVALLSDVSVSLSLRTEAANQVQKSMYLCCV
jgi:hypothetical protein